MIEIGEQEQFGFLARVLDAGGYRSGPLLVSTLE
jgi:hypothetical protein